MATNDETPWYDDFGDDYFAQPDHLPVNDLLFGMPWEVDQHAQDLFNEGVFGHDTAKYDELVEYMWFEYGINMNTEFDWDGWRDKITPV